MNRRSFIRKPYGGFIQVVGNLAKCCDLSEDVVSSIRGSYRLISWYHGALGVERGRNRDRASAVAKMTSS